MTIGKYKMGGKKIAKQNRMYEKNRRDRFNCKFIELNNLLPGINHQKPTKADTIEKAIALIKEMKKQNENLKSEIERGKNEINDLEKKVVSLLNTTKKLVQLLQASNIKIPFSLPLNVVDKSYSNSKRKAPEPCSDDEENNHETEFAETSSPSIDNKSSTVEKLASPDSSNPCSCSKTLHGATSPNKSDGSVETSNSVPTLINSNVLNLGLPSSYNFNVARLNTAAVLVPDNNLVPLHSNPVIFNGLPNAPNIILNRNVAPPTYLLMQTAFAIPNSTATLFETRKQRLIVPKIAPASTRTTFINKKPIPAICLHTSENVQDSSSVSHQPSKKIATKRSKATFVKLDKKRRLSVLRKIRSVANIRNKNLTLKQKGCLKNRNLKNNEQKLDSVKDQTATENCSTDVKEKETVCVSNSAGKEIQNDDYSEVVNKENKNIENEPADNLFESSSKDSTTFSSKNEQNEPYLDFFGNNTKNSSLISNVDVNTSVYDDRYLKSSNGLAKTTDSNTLNDNSVENNLKNNDIYNNINARNELSFVANNFLNENETCNIIEFSGNEIRNTDKNKLGEMSSVYVVKSGENDTRKTDIFSRDIKDNQVLEPPCNKLLTSSNDTSLLEYNNEARNKDCDLIVPSSLANYENIINTTTNNLISDSQNKQKNDSINERLPKELVPSDVNCSSSLVENKSAVKDFNLPVVEDKDKNYPHVSNFDEFSNDLFSTLQVPNGSQNAESISPTAAFLLSFPLVSSYKNVDMLPENDDDNVGCSASNLTAMRMGNDESSSNLFSSDKFSSTEIIEKKLARNQMLPEFTSAFDCNIEDNALLGIDIGQTVESSFSKYQAKDKCGFKQNVSSKKDKYSTSISSISNIFTNVNSSITYPQAVVTKEIVISGMENNPFYVSTASLPSFSSYNISKYCGATTDVTSYGLGSQFGSFKTNISEPLIEYSSWLPESSNTCTRPLEDTCKLKTKRDKSTSTHSNLYKLNVKSNEYNFNPTHSYKQSNANNTSTSLKHDKQKRIHNKQHSSSKLVNWMTTPDCRNLVNNSNLHLFPDVFSISKENEAGNNATFLNNTNNSTSNNAHILGGPTLSSCETFMETQIYSDHNLNYKVPYCVPSTTCAYTWSPTKSTFSILPQLDTNNVSIPCTLPTLVGDLALNNSCLTEKIYNLNYYYDNTSTKIQKRESCKAFRQNSHSDSSCHKNTNQGSFFSVTQLVDKERPNASESALEKQSGNKSHVKLLPPDNYSAAQSVNNINGLGICRFENGLPENRNRFGYPKGDYSCLNKNTDGSNSKSKSNYNYQEIKAGLAKSKKDNSKFNNSRYAVKEIQKDVCQPVLATQEKSFSSYSLTNNMCDDVYNKQNIQPQKHSTYSAESLIGSHNQNICNSQSYFAYTNNNLNYVNSNNSTNSAYEVNTCSNEFQKKNKHGTKDNSLPNMDYYSNTNYIYPNTFHQSINNYTLSTSQCYDNYPVYSQSTIQPVSQLKQQKEQPINWNKDVLLQYDSTMSNSFNSCSKIDGKQKQSFSANKFNVQKNITNFDMCGNKYNQFDDLPPTVKNNCNYDPSYSILNQSSQQCLGSGNSHVNYGKSNENQGSMNTNSVQQASSLTNFNLSAIFPEINEKCPSSQHCIQNRVENVDSNRKYEPQKINDGAINYNFSQPAVDLEAGSSLQSSRSNFQIEPYPHFISGKSHK